MRKAADSSARRWQEPRATRVWRKFRERGWLWFAQRIAREFVAPTTAPTLRLRNLLASAERFLGRLWQPKAGALGDPDTLYFMYDLEVGAVTYNFVNYLVGAELERRDLGLARIYVYFVAGKSGGLREEEPDYAAIVSHDARLWRVHNMLIPSLWLLPSVSGFTVCGGRDEAPDPDTLPHVFPAGYRPRFPLAPPEARAPEAARAGIPIFPMLAAPSQALRYARQFKDACAGARELVVITLRYYTYMPDRNSNIEAWAEFAKIAAGKGFAAVFVLDTETAMDKLPPALAGATICHAASWNMELRAALYETAYLNIGIAHGPFELCWYNHKCRYVCFIKLNAAPQVTPRALTERGFELGQSPPYAIAGQKWVWATDDLATITREFDSMCREIEKAKIRDE